MIHPGVAITDLDVEGFSHLCGVLSQRDRRPTQQLTVLHDRGTVLRAVAPAGAPGAFGQAFSDAQARADQLLADGGFERVVLLDRSGLDQVAAEVAEAAAATAVQSQLLEAAHRIFWESPAVATAPAPPPWPWAAVQAGLTRLGSGRLVLAAWRGDDCALRLQAEVDDGLVVRITSPAAAPSRAAAAELLGEGPAPSAALLVDIEVLDRILLDAAPLDALRRCLDDDDGVLHAHGLNELLWP